LYAMKYYFTDGKTTVPLAVYYFDGKRIWYEISYGGEKVDSPYFDGERLPRQLEQIIHLPLMRAELRAKTIPSVFKCIQPNTMEHFNSIPHDSTYFKFTPIVCRNAAGHQDLAESTASA
jgi:hypothetical protein